VYQVNELNATLDGPITVLPMQDEDGDSVSFTIVSTKRLQGPDGNYLNTRTALAVDNNGVFKLVLENGQQVLRLQVDLTYDDAPSEGDAFFPFEYAG